MFGKKHLTKHLMKKIFLATIATLMLCASMLLSQSCKEAKSANDAPLITTSSLLVVNEGNYMAGNADITAYDTTLKTTKSNLFATANGGAAMGDAPSAAVRHNGKLYVSLSGSAKFYVLNPLTLVLEGKVTGLDSPRCFAFESNSVAYLSHLNEPKITLFNPTTLEVVRTITYTGTAAENMILNSDGTISANEWNGGKRIIRIDPTLSGNDAVVESLEVGIQPTCLFKDAQGDLWTLCDGGGWDGNPIGFEAPTIVKIKVDSDGKMTIEKRFTLAQGLLYKMILDHSGNTLYFSAGDKIYRMNINDTELPTTSFIEQSGAMFYNLAQNPLSKEIYATNAKDFMSNGEVYRYNEQGELIDSFEAGISPSLMVF